MGFLKKNSYSDTRQNDIVSGHNIQIILVIYIILPNIVTLLVG